MRVSEIMTRDVAVVKPDDTIRRAAEVMDRLNIGSVPVCDGTKLVGIVTDRDITVRCTAAGLSPDVTPVRDAMSDEPRYCWADDDVADAERIMQEVQIRRLPVIDADRRLIGILSLGDLAADGAPGVEETIADISVPSRPDR